MSYHGFAPVGLLPDYYYANGHETDVVVAKLYGHANELRITRYSVIPEVRELAEVACRNLGVSASYEQADPPPYPDSPALTPIACRPQDVRRAVTIGAGRVKEPEIVGIHHLNDGPKRLDLYGARYLMLADAEGVPNGVLGYTHDQPNRVAEIYELIGETDEVKGALIRQADAALATTPDLHVISTEVVASAARMQRTLFDLGYRPCAYYPGRAFHDTYRTDTIRLSDCCNRWRRAR